METQLLAHIKSLVDLIDDWLSCFESLGWYLLLAALRNESSLGLQAVDLPEMAASASISDLKEDDSFFFKQSLLPQSF